MPSQHFSLSQLYFIVFLSFTFKSVLAEQPTILDDINVTEQQTANPNLRYTNPVSTITAEEAESINTVTIEDFLKYEPGLIVRRRYIGDPNGTIGIRGSNMFQTARSMVFADGLPVHYFLQTRFSGAPRWSLVSPTETESVETVYGPFSALYSGNAMGGVVNIKTHFPDKFEFDAQVSTFLQDFSFLGDDDTYFGHKEFVSFGNKFNDLSVYFSHNHLQNKSQPMSFFNPERSTPSSGTAVTGGFITQDEFGNDTVYFGDSGSEDVSTDLSKLKLGYDLGDWFANLTVAYEDRDRDADNAKTYLRDAAGNPVFSGDHSFNGNLFNANGRFGNLFRVSYEERETLLIGGAINGPIPDSNWDLTLGFSVFDIIKDQRLRSNRNPADPTFDASGRIREFDDTGWETFDLKLDSDQLLSHDDMRLTIGYHYDHYSLQVAEFTAEGDFRNGQKGSIRNGNPSAGETNTHAIFAEYGWQFLPHWDVVLGGRYEIWESENGQKGDNFFDDRREHKFSPKFSIGFAPKGAFSYRYSIAKAYRFPLVEELYENDDGALRKSIANAELSPEDGLHHNFAIIYNLHDGELSLNIFHENIDDVIFNQLDLASNASTFLNIDEVRTTGAEIVFSKEAIFDLPVDISSNLAYTNSKIIKNRFNPSVEGNRFPRLPRWRGNLLMTYHANEKWDISPAIRFASNSYGQLDNSDIAENVFGAQDSYIFVDLKTNYEWSDHYKISAGIDNLFGEEAFVFHPWPQRTYYLEASIKF